MAKVDKRTIIKDPLHKQIFISQRHKKIVDSKVFQRLRRIRQTSFANFVYPSAVHSRFTHSIGAYHLMKKVLDNKLNSVPSTHRDNLLLAALLHDIGHGPFSHVWEYVFPHFNHEEATIEILKRMKLEKVADIIEHKNKYSEFMSSSIDVDKLDYMARDSYFAGVSYGVSEVDFIIQHMWIEDGKMVITPSAVSSVEDLITQRVNLFKTVYYHKSAIMYDFIFLKIFERVRDLLKEKENLFIDDALLAFYNKTNTIDDLLALDDLMVEYHIVKWSNHKDKILSELASNFLNRKKFAVKNLKYSNIDPKKLEKKVAKDYDLRYYFGYKKCKIKILQSTIYVKVDNKLKKLEDVSELVKFYKKQKWFVEYVIFPKDVKI